MHECSLIASLNFDDGRLGKTVVIDLSEHTKPERAFGAPISDLTDPDALSARIFEYTKPNVRAQILAQREAVANHIAKDLANFLMDQMAKDDTLNGYKKDENVHTIDNDLPSV